MHLAATQLFTRARPTGWLGKTVQFPLVRVLIALLFLTPVLALSRAFSRIVYPSLSGTAVVGMNYLGAALFFALFFIAYRLYSGLVEKREASELGFVGCFRELGTGFLISAALVAAVVAVLAASGCYRVSSLNGTPRVAADLLVKFFMGAFLEELLFRMVLFRLTEELLGSWLALAIQALLFGFAHQANENATVFTSCAVAVIGGLVYTAAFMATRRLWFPLGLHLGWNYIQSGIFGMPNSGSPYNGLFIPAISGPSWLTGGAFGIEASWLAVGLCLATAAVLLSRAVRGRQLVPPLWSRGERGM